MTEHRRLAMVELLGALTYGELRAFETTARAVRLAPDARRMDQVATFAVREHAAYVRLRDHLIEHTDLGGAVMDRQKPMFDAFFDHAPLDDWPGAVAFFAVGLPMAADFIREIAPTLEPATAAVVVGALAERGPFEAFATEQLTAVLSADGDARERTRLVVGDVLGRALTGFQHAVANTDALTVLLGGAEAAGEAAGELVKRVAMHVLEGHRRRMHQLGLEDLV